MKVGILLIPEGDETLEDLLSRIQGAQPATITRVHPASAGTFDVEDGSEDRDEDWADLSFAQAKRLVKGLSERSKAFLQFIVENGGRAPVNQLAELMAVPHWRKLSGIQSGITQRVRTILSDENAYLLEWTEAKAKQKEDKLYSDGEWYLSPTSYASLQRVFNSDERADAA